MTRLDRSSHSGGGHAKGSRPLNSLVAGHRVAQPRSAPGSRASVQVGVCGETGGVGDTWEVLELGLRWERDVGSELGRWV